MISWNTKKIKEKMQRNAGRKQSVVTNTYTIGEIFQDQLISVK